MGLRGTGTPKLENPAPSTMSETTNFYSYSNNRSAQTAMQILFNTMQILHNGIHKNSRFLHVMVCDLGKNNQKSTIFCITYLPEHGFVGLKLQ